jgi:hypothetical protein
MLELSEIFQILKLKMLETDKEEQEQGEIPIKIKECENYLHITKNREDEYLRIQFDEKTSEKVRRKLKNNDIFFLTFLMKLRDEEEKEYQFWFKNKYLYSGTFSLSELLENNSIEIYLEQENNELIVDENVENICYEIVDCLMEDIKELPDYRLFFATNKITYKIIK